jgi:hypothetical protein
MRAPCSELATIDHEAPHADLRSHVEELRRHAEQKAMFDQQRGDRVAHRIRSQNKNTVCQLARYRDMKFCAESMPYRSLTETNLFQQMISTRLKIRIAAPVLDAFAQPTGTRQVELDDRGFASRRSGGDQARHGGESTVGDSASIGDTGAPVHGLSLVVCERNFMVEREGLEA